MNESKAPPKIRHHFIPQFYLRYFSPDNAHGKIWYYSKNLDEPKLVPIKSVAFIKHFYSLEISEGEQWTGYEERFSQIETLIAPLINSVLMNESLPTGDELEVLIRFLLLLSTRTPDFRKNQLEPTWDEMRFRTEQILTSDHITPDDINYIQTLTIDSQLMNNDPIDQIQKINEMTNQSIPKRSLIDSIFKSANSIYDLIKDLHWSILGARDSYKFVTSDSPLTLWGIPRKEENKIGFKNDVIQVSIPLSPTICLLGTHETEPDKIIVPRQMVDEINQRTINSSDEFVFANFNSKKYHLLLNKNNK